MNEPLWNLLRQMHNCNISIIRCHTFIDQDGVVYHVSLSHRLLWIVKPIWLFWIDRHGKETDNKIACSWFSTYYRSHNVLLSLLCGWHKCKQLPTLTFESFEKDSGKLNFDFYNVFWSHHLVLMYSFIILSQMGYIV